MTQYITVWVSPLNLRYFIIKCCKIFIFNMEMTQYITFMGFPSELTLWSQIVAKTLGVADGLQTMLHNCLPAKTAVPEWALSLACMRLYHAFSTYKLNELNISYLETWFQTDITPLSWGAKGRFQRISSDVFDIHVFPY